MGDLPQLRVPVTDFSQERPDAGDAGDDRPAFPRQPPRAAVAQQVEPDLELGPDLTGQGGQLLVQPEGQEVGPVIGADADLGPDVKDMRAEHPARGRCLTVLALTGSPVSWTADSIRRTRPTRESVRGTGRAVRRSAPPAREGPRRAQRRSVEYGC